MQRIEEPISYFRQQDIATACLDLMDAQISMLRGNRAEALVSLRKTAVGRKNSIRIVAATVGGELTFKPVPSE